MSKQKQTYDSAALRALRDTKLAQQADPAEQARRALTSHERVIENARRSFVDMGRALLAIRTERLYAAEYSNFGDYCDARWDISEAYANRVINAALVAIEATPIGVEINSEAVARELVGLTDKPKQLRQIWDEATRRAAGGRVTAALVKEVRQSLESPALDGELVDPLDSIPDAAKQAIEDKLAQQNQTSDTAGTSPAGGVGETAADVDTAPADGGDVPPPAAGADDHADRSAPAVTPQDHRGAKPGDAAQDDVSGARTHASRGDEVESEVDASISDLADRREQQDVAGASRPAAPASRHEETDEERAAREDLEFRTDRTLEFCQALVDLTMRLGSNPIKWFESIYVHGVYPDRNLPRVRDCFEPQSLHRLAAHLDALGEYMTQNGKTL